MVTATETIGERDERNVGGHGPCRLPVLSLIFIFSTDNYFLEGRSHCILTVANLQITDFTAMNEEEEGLRLNRAGAKLMCTEGVGQELLGGRAPGDL